MGRTGRWGAWGGGVHGAVGCMGRWGAWGGGVHGAVAEQERQFALEIERRSIGSEYSGLSAAARAKVASAREAPAGGPSSEGSLTCASNGSAS